MTQDDSDTSSGRRPRAGESGAPVGSILSIVLAVAAVAIGLFILQQIDDDGDGVSAPPERSDRTEESSVTSDGSTPPNGSGEPNDTTTTAPPNVRKGATVVVANANTTGGSAGQMSEQLRVAGFTMGEPKDAAGDEVQLDRTKVYFVDGNATARDVAATAARLLGGAEVAKMPRQIPVDGGRIDGQVLVMLGVEEAGKPLDELTS